MVERDAVNIRVEINMYIRSMLAYEVVDAIATVIFWIFVTVFGGVLLLTVMTFAWGVTIEFFKVWFENTFPETYWKVRNRIVRK